MSWRGRADPPLAGNAGADLPSLHSFKAVGSDIRSDLEVLMPFQCFYQGREKGDEPFGADAVGSVPDQEERVLDVRSIAAQM